MIVLLPPSETKQVVFEGPTFDKSDLQLSLTAHPKLIETQAEIWAEYQVLLQDVERAKRVLKLGSNLKRELDLLKGVAATIGLPAIRRYNGVLYQAMLSELKSAPEERILGLTSESGVFIQSALFGLVAANQPLPYYRLSASSPLGNVSLRQRWCAAYSMSPAVFRGRHVVDFRSQTNRQLTPPLTESNHFSVSVYSTSQSKVLNHFNKKAKGQFAAALILEMQSFNGSHITANFELEKVARSAAQKVKLGVEFSDNQIRLRVE